MYLLINKGQLCVIYFSTDAESVQNPDEEISTQSPVSQLQSGVTLSPTTLESADDTETLPLTTQEPVDENYQIDSGSIHTEESSDEERSLSSAQD